jgi:hypothetical protein
LIDPAAVDRLTGGPPFPIAVNVPHRLLIRLCVPLYVRLGLDQKSNYLFSGVSISIYIFLPDGSTHQRTDNTTVVTVTIRRASVSVWTLVGCRWP